MASANAIVLAIAGLLSIVHGVNPRQGGRSVTRETPNVRARCGLTQRRGREKLHYLNPVPIQEIADRWIGKFERSRLRVLADLKKRLEDVAYEGEFTTGKPARSRRS
jgi:hypothetical protein